MKVRQRSDFSLNGLLVIIIEDGSDNVDGMATGKCYWEEVLLSSTTAVVIKVLTLYVLVLRE
jgi:hypothetical protein